MNMKKCITTESIRKVMERIKMCINGNEQVAKWERIDFLLTLDETNHFLELAIFVGWIRDKYGGPEGIRHFLEKPYKWQKEHEYAKDWAKNILDTNDILMIMEGDNAVHFMDDFNSSRSGS